jgi:hypothetical protein
VYRIDVLRSFSTPDSEHTRCDLPSSPVYNSIPRIDLHGACVPPDLVPSPLSTPQTCSSCYCDDQDALLSQWSDLPITYSGGLYGAPFSSLVLSSTFSGCKVQYEEKLFTEEAPIEDDTDSLIQWVCYNFRAWHTIEACARYGPSSRQTTRCT